MEKVVPKGNIQFGKNYNENGGQPPAPRLNQVPNSLNSSQPSASNNNFKENRDGLGLEISKRLNEDYGEKWMNNPVDKASGYSACLRKCGAVPQVACCICAPCDLGPVKKIPSGYIGLVIELGRLVKKLEPGLHSYNQCCQEVQLVDIRTKVFDVPVQSLLTRDNVSIKVDAYVVYRVEIPELALFRVSNYVEMLSSMTQGILKTVIVEKTLSELLVKRDEVESYITELIDEKTDLFGVDVQSIEFKQITLPRDMMRSFAKEAQAKKEAEAKIIKAQGSLASAKLYRKSADLMQGNPVSLQLQYFETLRLISMENNKTYIMPDSMIRLFADG